MSDGPTASIFGGRYQVERELARGGMAEVYLGRDLVLHRAVALKVLAGTLSRDEGFVERFRREARAAAKLNHPNIVAVYDWGEAEGAYFIVMEYVAGENLAQLLRAAGPLAVDRTTEIGAEIATALAAAHAEGMVHRDVKPGNVLVDPSGKVKVTDFGIARAAQIGAETPLTQAGMVLGTAAYLSPEQAEGRPADARSDVYGLGVVLYEMATGRPPFRGDTPVSVAYQHARSRPEPPRSLTPAVPAWLEAVILRALAKDPDLRYASAEDLRADLLSGEVGGTPEQTVPMAGVAAATGAAPTRLYEPVAAPAHRRWSRRSGLAAVAIGVAAAIALGTYLATLGPSGSGAARGPASTSTTPPPTSRPTTTSPPPSSTTTTSPPPTTSLATSFAGYAIVAGSGTGALYCPTGTALGTSGQVGPPGNGPPGNGPPGNGPPGNGTAGAPGSGGQGGRAGCGSNGGTGGHGGQGAPGAAGGAAGNGGDGGCPPATLAQMRSEAYPCNGTGSDGGNGGNGGNGAPGENGGPGGVGGNGGNAQKAKGGNGGMGGNATPAGPGGAGGPGQSGGGPTGTSTGVNGLNGTNGTNG